MGILVEWFLFFRNRQYFGSWQRRCEVFNGLLISNIFSLIWFVGIQIRIIQQISIHIISFVSFRKCFRPKQITIIVIVFKTLKFDRNKILNLKFLISSCQSSIICKWVTINLIYPNKGFFELSIYSNKQKFIAIQLLGFGSATEDKKSGKQTKSCKRCDDYLYKCKYQITGNIDI